MGPVREAQAAHNVRQAWIQAVGDLADQLAKPTPPVP